MLRRLYHEQPDSFAFTPENLAWAEAQITKYPEGRQASAIIPLLWRAQEQEGWLSRKAIETVADMLGLAHIRALEVATFYFMFQLQPVGAVAHIQVCGTTSCMICGAEDLIAVCREKIAPNAHELSEDGKLSWEEVECLGACANAPMAQIGKDYYEDLTAERFGEIIDAFSAGEVPTPGPQNGRYASEPASGLTSLKDHESGRMPQNASVALAAELGDTVKRIDGTEVPILTPWLSGKTSRAPAGGKTGIGADKADRSNGHTADETGIQKQQAPAKTAAKPAAKAKAAPTPVPADEDTGAKPETLSAPRGGAADNLKEIKGVGPKLEKMLNEMGFYHFDQIAGWTADEVAWVDANLTGFKGRVSRDDWVAQAKILAAGGDTEFSKRVDKGDVY
ncbi:NADH-quinone oxidoreductase subunit E [Lutimaribacter sp. EGI FJ00015]|uniref:NADH-quinone oxidoreductase subunit E n=1 Tax=Lutimaribacter degradans TaxID=2945989 RepID=A0ACC5ZRE8_9RHOB|nr:NADH-quinone oxidoreductase subunit E [Lutimaribacter sp. EGI FJ00013]MCM2560861.1 NADH-quinone oxidoreductase subunit E [Lutimaribacter sp. EGI FJ00013]MCO0612194.1 NADH-quinone oxidoreductase subunit E [Lutimaribacter sp. EGI FJ00015]MCO0634686.1 NADH-quinone oxidoreductase subunit E [Lutimaribacter sp. EGI FJ00014]